MDKTQLEALVRQILLEKLGGAHGVCKASVSALRFTEADRLDTGDPAHRVYTHDLFSLEQSPRLGAGLMEMEDTTFPWTLGYDEMDYVLEGQLSILIAGETVTAGPGEALYLPKGSSIQFSAAGRTRFLYFVTPADWQNQG
jgi:ethanolamine utilization protein EutQ